MTDIFHTQAHGGWVNILRRVIFLVSLPLGIATAAQTPDLENLREALPAPAVLREWVAEMKAAPRGPFRHIRWFCNDGTIQEPREYACRDHGGGVQHGEWTDRVKLLRAHGYYIATVFADIKPDLFLTEPDVEAMVRQMILEQFLILAEDGWILRRARYYRGALQAEDETANGRALLLEMAGDGRMHGRDFPVLREAVRFFPHGRSGAPVSDMRQLSLSIAEKDADFEALRIKIHVKPQLEDAQSVRAYAGRQGRPELSEDYERLAALIETVFRQRDVGAEVAALAKQVKHPQLARQLRQRIGQLSPDNDPWIRFAAAARLLAVLRETLPEVASNRLRLQILDLGLDLEADLFQSANALMEVLARASRRERLSWLDACVSALYGSGLLSARQRQALTDGFARLALPTVALIDYKSQLDYASRVPGWADRTMRFHFTHAVETLAVLDSRVRAYLHDRLRGSLLLFYSGVLETLMADANLRLGIQNSILDLPVDVGLTALNPGLARGVLRVYRPGDPLAEFDPRGIYVLPASFDDLPPVAGIMTAGEGNMLSHVQLLARNLGIPNVAVANTLLAQLERLEGRQVVLAVSPKGVVQLSGDASEWDAFFAAKADSSRTVRITPDLAKLDLSDRRLIPLGELRAADSGRVCGPKAANLGELKHFFPEAVTEGVVIPFGVFRALLEQPIEAGGPSAFEWMRDQYERIQGLPADSDAQRAAVGRFLTAVRTWILSVDPGDELRNRLRAAAEEIFGADGTYGVFVRSDTNVEDLPGFTGAGLNKTVPHVVGFENIMGAVRQVWASPFSERAYRWRQAFMATPEHVYVSVLLLKSVPVEKSGVMITADVETGAAGWLSIAVNEGVGGAVSGQTAEELRYRVDTGELRLLSHATEPVKRVLLAGGGIGEMPASGSEALLTAEDIGALAAFAAAVPQRFPKILNAQGEPVPADIEFGFLDGRLVLFQIRPFLESTRARRNLYLNEMDRRLDRNFQRPVPMAGVPGEADK